MELNRRRFLSLGWPVAQGALLGNTLHDISTDPPRASRELKLAIHFDRRGSRLAPIEIDWFWRRLFAEATRDFAKAGISLVVKQHDGWIERQENGAVFHGIVHSMINVFVTFWIPLCWDEGRGLCGLSGVAARADTIIVAAANAHRHLVPYLATNTLAHELAHILRRDPHRRNAHGWSEQRDEFTLDRVITHMHYGFVEPQFRKWVAGLESR